MICVMLLSSFDEPARVGDGCLMVVDCCCVVVVVVKLVLVRCRCCGSVLVGAGSVRDGGRDLCVSLCCRCRCCVAAPIGPLAGWYLKYC